MEDETPAELELAASVRLPEPAERREEAAPPESAHRLDPPESNSHEQRLRALAGRSAPYDGPIIGIAHGWVSRDTKPHVFAARFLDFAVITDEHLMFCSTGFFSRRPRRRVFLEPFKQLGIVAQGTEPYRTLRIVGDFNNPLLFELGSDPNSLAFAHELLERTRAGREFLRAKELPAPEETAALPAPDEVAALEAPHQPAAIEPPNERAEDA
jgi:hypothetical protein